MIIGPETLTARCDRCGREDELPAAAQVLFPLSNPGFKLFGVLPETLARAGWFDDKGGKLLCPDCANVREGGG